MHQMEVVVSIIIMAIVLVVLLAFVTQSNVDVWSTFKGVLG